MENKVNNIEINFKINDKKLDCDSIMVELKKLKNSINIVMQMFEDDCEGNNLTSLENIFDALNYYYNNN